MKYIESAKKPYPFCPGCTHGLILDAIGAALERIGADPGRMALVSDIGCVGLADRFFNLHTFHGLHGRSFTYACGLKLADPGLNVFVLVGDGGCGIGGHHLINAARRNIGIKVLCFDNFNFGMTGGEHSVTTPIGGKTHTTPSGSIERPFDLCALAIAAGAPFVARKTAFDPDLPDAIAAAFSREGFAFLDMLEICTAYYMPLNDFNKSAMMTMMGKTGLGQGILKDEAIPEYSMELRRAWPEVAAPAPTPKGIAVEFEPEGTAESFQAILAGSAGQKVVSAASTLARAGLSCGLYASQQDDYPVTVQTGHSVSEIRLARERIHCPEVDAPDAVVIISQDGLKEVEGRLASLPEGAIVIMAEGLPEIKTRAKILRANFKGKAGVTKTNQMIAAISLLLHARSVIPPEAFKRALEAAKSDAIRASSLKAFEAGGQMWGEVGGGKP